MTNTTQSNYQKERNIESTLKLREIIRELPPFAVQFFTAIESSTSALTRLNYARDLRIFFRFLQNEVAYFMDRPTRDLDVEDLERLTVDDLYTYMDYLNVYPAPDEDDAFIENHERGKARKAASLRSFFKHFYKKGKLDRNIAELLDTPKQHEKPIIRLSAKEVSDLLDIVESGEGLTTHQLRYHKQTVKRDLAILTLFLSTGIRVSELVGMNVEDIDLQNNSFVVTRKGGNRVVLYFDVEAHEALSNYLEQRKSLGTYSTGTPLFLSMQNKRMTVRSVENMVKKYAQIAAPLKRISPHKLRSTFGTMLYDDTGDIYLVADVLGHKDVNTTRRHYAAQTEENRKRAAKTVKLRH